jgi:predicted lactoylglutathione lyase
MIEDAMSFTRVFIHVAVREMQKSMEFFAQCGLTIQPGAPAVPGSTYLRLNDESCLVLHSRDHFASVSRKAHVDPTGTEVIVQLQISTRARVDDFVDRALAAGATRHHPPTDRAFLYGRSFQDIDGHLWDVFCADPDAQLHAHTTEVGIT